MKGGAFSLLVLLGFLFGGFAWLRFAPDDPPVLRLTIRNHHSSELLVEAVSIDAEARPLPGTGADGTLRIAPRHDWRGRFTVAPGGPRRIRVSMSLPAEGMTFDAQGTMDASSDRSGLACWMSVRFHSVKPASLNECLYDLDVDYAN